MLGPSCQPQACLHVPGSYSFVHLSIHAPIQLMYSLKHQLSVFLWPMNSAPMLALTFTTRSCMPAPHDLACRHPLRTNPTDEPWRKTFNLVTETHMHLVRASQGSLRRHFQQATPRLPARNIHIDMQSAVDLPDRQTLDCSVCVQNSERQIKPGES